MNGHAQALTPLHPPLASVQAAPLDHHGRDHYLQMLWACLPPARGGGTVKHAWEAAAPYMNASIASETNGIWTIELYRRPSGANEVRFETPDGASYWGSQYENGAWRYDWPERIPGYVKGRARRLWARYPDSFTRRVTSL